MKIRTEPVVIRSAVAGLVAILAVFGIDAAGIEAPVANALAIGLPLLMAALDARRKVFTQDTHDADVAAAYDAGTTAGFVAGAEEVRSGRLP